jgi:tetratricopeptide (TPR) repeat protein
VQIVEALYQLESRRLRDGPDAGLFRAAALSSARLMEALSPDVMESGDRIAAYGLAFLAAAGTVGPDRAPIREEAELAKAMGFSSYAARLVRRHPEQFADSYGRMLSASLSADLPAIHDLLTASPPEAGIVLAARTYRRLGLVPGARQAASLLLKSNPALFFTLPGDILPENPEIIQQLAARTLDRIFTELSIEPGPAEAGGIVPLERFTKELSVEIGRKWPENAVLLIDRGRVASVFESVYARALLMQLEHLTAKEAAKRTAALVDQTAEGSPAHPLALFMQAVLRHRAGKTGPAAETASALISRPDASLFLCDRAWQILDDPVAWHSLGPEMIRQVNGSPGHRFVLAGVLENLGQIDDAEKRLRKAAEALPPATDIYRALCRLTGSATPLEAAVTENPRSVWLQAAAGQYWAEKTGPAALEKALAHFREAGRLEPGNPLWGRKSAAVLLRMGKREAAAGILEALADGKERSNSQGRAADRMALANLYLDMNHPEKALALVKPEQDLKLAETMVIAARAYQIGGQYGRALAAFGEVVKRYPSTPAVLSAAAAFNWGVGRYHQAAELIARGRAVAGPLCNWYIEDFRQVFASAPTPKVTAAVDALKNTGAGPRELECLALDLRDAGRLEAALFVLDGIKFPTARQQTAAAATVARITLRWKGAAAAAEAIARRFDGSGTFSAAEVLLQLGLYPQALAAVGNPEDYPQPLAERAWLIRTLAWLGSDRKPAHLEEETLEHYRGSWLQQKTARVTGVLSRDPVHAAGRFLTGMITVDEMMAWATTSEMKCRFAYYAGFSERLKKRYRRAADWYAACLAAGKPDIAEYRWAEEELTGWALTGTAHRHRSLAEDQSYLWGKGSGK